MACKEMVAIDRMSFPPNHDSQALMQNSFLAWTFARFRKREYTEWEIFVSTTFKQFSLIQGFWTE